MSIYKQFKTSEKHEVEGVWLDYGDAGRLRIARAGGNNKPYLKAIEKKFRQVRRQLQLNILPPETVDRIMREVAAETLVTGWEMVGEGGEKIPYTKEAIVKTFEDLPDFFDDVLTQARNTAVFKEDLIRQDQGN